jgi:hypothetical protein
MVDLSTNAKNEWTHPTSVPESQFQKVVTGKKLETLTVARLGDWYGDMKKIQYPVQVVDCIRDIILNLAWHKLNITGASFAGREFMAMAAYLSDYSLTKMGSFQELGINPAAWTSRYARTLAIQYANDSVVMTQQLLVQCLSRSRKQYQDFVTKANKKIPEAKEKWNGDVWGFGEYQLFLHSLACLTITRVDLLIAFARALGNIYRSKKPDLSEKGKQFKKESKGIFIVLTTDSQEGRHSDGWQDMTPFWEFKRRLRIVMQNLPYQFGGIDPAKIDLAIDTLLHFKRTSTSALGDSKTDLYLHSKVVAVDRKVMYVGSDNAYPSYNEEHGVWIEDQGTIDGWLDGFFVDFWNMCSDPTPQDASKK